MDQFQELRALPIQAVLAHVGVVQEWKERRGGTEWSGKCPVHQPKKNTSSFSFHQDGRFQCFSCGAKGRGAIDLLMAVRQIGFQEAVEVLQGLDGNAIGLQAKKPEIKQLPPNVVKEGFEPSENEPFHATYDKFAVESAWLKERGFTPETLKHFGVFEYDNPKRQSQYKGKILFPIRRFKDGAVVGYLARNPKPAEGEPKYLFPKGVFKHLEMFGSWQLKNDQGQVVPRRLVYLVESPLCVMKFWQMGLPAVSPFGWSVSDEQIGILESLAKGCVFLPDRDKHQQATEQAGRLARRVWVKLPELPSAVTDPEQMTVEQIRSVTRQP